MESAHKHNALISEPIAKLLIQLAIPASVGFFFNTMYNVVDTWVAGQLSSEALASLSISFPVFFIIIALSMGVGTGATALIANQLGGGHEEEGKRYATQVISFGLLLSILVSILGYLTSPWLFTVLGAQGNYLETALSYMQPVFLGSIFLSMTSVLNGILNAVGDTKSFRNVLIAGFFINLLLSPMLAFGWIGLPELGVFGIALATILTNALGAIYIGFKVLKTGLIETDCFRLHLIPQRAPFIEIATQGFPASFSMMTVAVGAFIITYFVSQFGENAVAGYGVALRVEQIFLIPGIGINIAVLTLIGQNNGAKLFSRVRETVSVGLRYVIYISTLASACIFFLSPYLIGIFTENTLVKEFGIEYLNIAALITWAYGIVFITDSTLRGLKRPLFPLIIGIVRQVILPLPIFYVVTILLSFSIFGLWWSIFAIVWLSALVSLWYMQRLVHKKCQKSSISFS